MKIAVLGGDGFVGWPTALHLSDLGHEIHIVDNLSRRWIDTELGVQSLTPMDLDPGAHPHLAPGERPPHPLPPARPRPRLRDPEVLARRAPPGGDHPLRRAARRALFDEDRPPQGLHRQQQRQRHPQPLVRAGGNRPRRPSPPPRHHGRLRLFHGRRRHPRRLPAGRHRDPRRRGQAPGDPLPDPPRLDLPHDQEPRSDPLPVLRPERRPPDHRPAPGHRLGHPHRARPAATSS